MSTTQQPHPMTIPDLASTLSRRPSRKPSQAPTKSTPPPRPAPHADRQEEPINVPLQQEAIPAVPTQKAQRTAERTRSAAKSSAVSPTRIYSQPMSLYLPRSVHQELVAKAETRKSTNTALILEAVNATHTRLGEGLTTAVPAATDLFAIPQRRTDAEPTVQTTIRVTDAQLAAIEDLSATYAVNRSQIIAAAVRLYLDV